MGRISSLQTPMFSSSMMKLSFGFDFQQWVIDQMHKNYKQQFYAALYKNYCASIILQDVANMYLMGGEL